MTTTAELEEQIVEAINDAISSSEEELGRPLTDEERADMTDEILSALDEPTENWVTVNWCNQHGGTTCKAGGKEKPAKAPKEPKVKAEKAAKPKGVIAKLEKTVEKLKGKESRAKVEKKPDLSDRWEAVLKDWDEKPKAKDVDPKAHLADRSVMAALEGLELNQRKNPWRILNAGMYGNPQSTATGMFKRHGSGTGKGEFHEAAQRGAMIVTAEDAARGADAASQADAGYNPPNWAVDEAKWEKAKAAADKGQYGPDSYWAVVSHIYQRMGGTIHGKGEATANAWQTVNSGHLAACLQDCEDESDDGYADDECLDDCLTDNWQLV